MGTKLNKHPVLFIPGNMGSADQVRSMSSPMHNKDEFFQYFAVHFNTPLSAIHGSLLLSQAAFVNDALETIREMYNKPVQIMVVGHSLGGMVARTAVALSNHPKPLDGKCAVSDIVMLSTPNRAAPYSTDGSMEAVYTAVNRVWRESHYNESVGCKRSKLEASDPFLSRRSPTKGGGTVSFNLKCAPCAAETRLLSVSGGDLDLLVPPHLTPVDIVAPLARNVTVIGSTKKGTFFGGNSVFLSGLGWLSPITMVKGLVSGARNVITSGWGGAAVAVDGNETSTTDAPPPVKEPEPVPVPEPAVSDASVKNESDAASGGDPLLSFTLEDWNEHISPYKESVQYSVRSMQVKDVGFPIDHNALLWCRQLIGAVSDAMRKIKEKDEKVGKSGKKDSHAGGVTSASLTKYLPLRPSSEGKAVIARAIVDGKSMIAPVAAFHLRNATSHAYSTLAAEDDRSYMAEVLPLGYFQALAVSYVTNHFVTDTLKWYMFLAIMVLIVPIRRKLTSFGSVSAKGSSDDWAVMTMGAWLHLEDIVPAVATLVAGVLSVLLPPATLQSPFYLDLFPSKNAKSSKAGSGGKGVLALVGVTFVAMAARFFVDLWWHNGGALLTTLQRYNYREWLHLVVSLFAALLLRSVLLAVVYGLRSIVSVVLGVCTVVMRSTVYRKGVRKWLRKKTGDKSVLPGGLYMPIFWTAVCGTVVVSSFGKDSTARHTLGFGYWVFLTLILSTGLTALLAVLRSLLCPPHDDSSDAYHLHTSLALLYLPLLVLAMPSIGYAYFALLGGGSSSFSGVLETFHVFSSMEMNAYLSMLCITLHLWTATVYGAGYASLKETPALVWLSSQLLGRTPGTTVSSSSTGRGGKSPAASKATDLWSVDSDSEEEEEQGFGGTLRVDGECFHEDGGRMAIFEEICLPSKDGAQADKDDAGEDRLAADGGNSRNNSGGGSSTPSPRKKRAKSLSQEVVTPDVIIGSTYRVVSCKCARDYRLKEERDWCSYCRCKFCGGKNLASNYGDRSGWNPSGSGSYPTGNLLDIVSANAYLAIALFFLGLFTHLYAADRPHRHLYIMGGVSAAYLLRDMCVTMGFLKP
jgi:hypothetical protein